MSLLSAEIFTHKSSIFTTEFLIQEYMNYRKVSRSVGWLVGWSVCYRFFVGIPLGSCKRPIVEVTWIIIFMRMLHPPKKDVDNLKRDEVVFLFGVIAYVSHKFSKIKSECL